MTAGRVRSPTLGQRRFVHALVNGPKAFAIGWMLTPARQSVAPRESYSPCGRGPTRVLVMNDWLCDTSTWDGARQYLARSRFTFAFVDLRGCGRSTFASRAIHPSQGVQVRSILRSNACDPWSDLRFLFATAWLARNAASWHDTTARQSETPRSRSGDTRAAGASYTESRRFAPPTLRGKANACVSLLRRPRRTWRACEWTPSIETPARLLQWMQSSSSIHPPEIE